VAHAARVVEKRNACRVLVGKSEVKRLLWRHRRGWDSSINGCQSKRLGGREVASTGSGLRQVAGCCENVNETLCSIKCGEFLFCSSIRWWTLLHAVLN
jgi:hypothetical protein